MASLRTHLTVFCIALAAACAGLGLLVYMLYDGSAGAQMARMRSQTDAACSAIAARYVRSASGVVDERARTELLQVILQLVLVERPHIEGGVWSPSQGHLVYAFPTYEGTGLKRDVPEAERGHIESVVRDALAARQARTDTARTIGEALVVSACPLATDASPLVAWTMGRTSISALDAQRNLRLALGAIGALVIVSGAWFTGILLRSAHHVRTVVERLEAADAREDWSVPSTGVWEFDRLLSAFDDHRALLVRTQAELRAAQRLHARDQRLASLGRMTAGVAHEIRNPVAAMRLRVENALAGPPEAHADGLRAVLAETVRLDELVRALMALVQPIDLHQETFWLSAWLRERLDEARNAASDKGVSLALSSEDSPVQGDPRHLARAIDNLLDNAVRHARSRVRVGARIDAAARRAVVVVADDGPGVDVALVDRLFEPFATGRPQGHGLGLALAREVALAHGGDIAYARTPEGGAEFKLEWTWHA